MNEFMMRIEWKKKDLKFQGKRKGLEMNQLELITNAFDFQFDICLDLLRNQFIKEYSNLNQECVPRDRPNIGQ